MKIRKSEKNASADSQMGEWHIRHRHLEKFAQRPPALLDIELQQAFLGHVLLHLLNVPRVPLRIVYALVPNPPNHRPSHSTLFSQKRHREDQDAVRPFELHGESVIPGFPPYVGGVADIQNDLGRGVNGHEFAVKIATRPVDSGTIATKKSANALKTSTICARGIVVSFTENIVEALGTRGRVEAVLAEASVFINHVSKEQ